MKTIRPLPPAMTVTELAAVVAAGPALESCGRRFIVTFAGGMLPAGRFEASTEMLVTPG